MLQRLDQFYLLFHTLAVAVQICRYVTHMPEKRRGAWYSSKTIHSVFSATTTAPSKKPTPPPCGDPGFAGEGLSPPSYGARTSNSSANKMFSDSLGKSRNYRWICLHSFRRCNVKLHINNFSRKIQHNLMNSCNWERIDLLLLGYGFAC